MKRLLGYLLCGALLVTALAGCRQDDDGDDDGGNGGQDGRVAIVHVV
ncbi:hypothetical protein [Deinococcus peraridilitoris]|nr:hypothetical protein [Deinococcus peraridilitoris]